MKTDILLIFRYWSRHKRLLLSFLTIFVILVAYTFISFGMVRTELRRVYSDLIYTNGDGTGYSSYGNGSYNQILYNVKKPDFPQLEDKAIISEYESVLTAGYMGTDSYNYTFGAYPTERAAEMGGYRLVSGSMPQQSGEIAISELALEHMGIPAELGDTITLNTYNHEREKTGSVNVRVAGIFQDNGTNSDWDTNLRSMNRYFRPVILLSFV